MDIPVKRLPKELTEVMNDETCQKEGFYLMASASNICDITGVIPGPPDTPYEGGKFKLNIVIPSEYPFKPPKIHFITKVWHPNVSSVTGAICLDILSNAWVPALSLKSVLMSIRILLSVPVPDDPQDAVVANQMKERKPIYEKIARQWVRMFAGGVGKPAENGEWEELVQKLVDAGYERSKSINSLSNNHMDLQKSLLYLEKD